MPTDLKIRMIMFSAIALVVVVGFVRAVDKVGNIFSPQVAKAEITQVNINNHIVDVDLAISEESKERGLSGRPSLGQNLGMLFLYDNRVQPAFWMKDMKFPIDIIWIANNKIVDISENLPVPTSSELPRYTPKKAVDAVLEVSSGWVKTNEVRIGDKVKYR